VFKAFTEVCPGPRAVALFDMLDRTGEGYLELSEWLGFIEQMTREKGL